MSGLDDLGISLDDVLNAPEVQEAKRETARKALAYWKSVSPEDEGDYKASLRIVERDDEIIIRADSDIAHIIEYGAEHMPQEWAPRAKTQSKFGRE